MLILAWVKNHWRLSGWIASMALSAAIAWRAKPQPEVELQATNNITSQSDVRTAEHVVTGPTSVTITVGTPADRGSRPSSRTSQGRAYEPCLDTPRSAGVPASLPDVVAALPPGSTVEIHQGPTVSDSREVDSSKTTDTTTLNFKQSPPTSGRGGSLGFQFDDVFRNRSLSGVRIEGGIELLGPLWLRVGVPLSAPLHPSAGIEIHFHF